MSLIEPTSVARAPVGPLVRPAATLVVVRDGARGLEVLLLRRAERGDHNSGAWVFPGGLLEASDDASQAACCGLDEALASERLGLRRGGVAYHVAALRECFEECGLLFAVDAQGREVAPERVVELQGWRRTLHAGECSVLDFAAGTGLRFAADRLAYLSHWLTPLALAKRFDVRFFVAVAPAGQAAFHDGIEMTAHRWLRCADALAPEAGLKFITPTRATLQVLSRFERCSDLMAWVREPRPVPLIFPRVGVDVDGPRPVLPTEPAFAEIGRLDPDGHGGASCVIVPGRAVRLSRRIRRVTADNAGVMTGPGTNSYLVGGGPRNEWAVIDPGPLDAAHVQALLDAAPGPIRRIFVTHTHTDHSPAAALLKERTGAPTHGRLAAFPERQDPSFVPDHPLAGGERIVIDEGVTLRVIHTPGHASNHLCYLLEEEQTLFTGDHVMQGSTVVINPPDGDMAAYIASLQTLPDACAPGVEWLAPGHGFLMDEPRRAFAGIVAHRLQRETKVLEAVRAHGPGRADELLPQVYDDVSAARHGIALRSLLAHLIKLRDEGRVREHDGQWSPAGR
jgi:glyoxylase-like metal-dependent hydrolase (beta-lactamase superfamily II)/8-oxo-dGTP pyrophosphatase MutT (NUDIX family)